MRPVVSTVVLALTVCAVPARGWGAAQQPAPPQTSPPAQPPTTQQPAPGQTAPTQTAPAPGAPAVPQTGRVIAADAGLIFFPVKVERVADFEKIMAKLKEALAMSDDPVRKEQAASWKVFKAVEPGPNSTALYVFLIDPAVKGSDYAFWKTLYDAFPAEVQELYRLYNAAAASGQTLLNLQLIQTFGPSPQQ
jgi:hypothetical protein